MKEKVFVFLIDLLVNEKNILKNHGGSIYFESKVNIGTSFFMKFPK